MDRHGTGNFRRKRYLIAACISLLPILWYGHVLGTQSLALYELWETEVKNSKEYSNPFDFREIKLQVVLTSPTGIKIPFYGFYDGNGVGSQVGDIWKIRFMPDTIGMWSYTYTWTDGTPGGSGDFTVRSRTNPNNHGHVGVDPKNPAYLVYDDGTPHYWYGAKWFNEQAFLCEKEILLSYLDVLASYRHNGILVKHGLYPLQDDRSSFDIKSLHCRDVLIKMAQKRGIYVQVNFFDTWSRKLEGRERPTNGAQHVLNAWNNKHLAEKEFYIQYLVARYAGFSNVYWELGNEMEHYPNSGTAFVSLANQHYIPWIRKYDPYDLPIGLSEGVGLTADVDIHFVHSNDNKMPPEKPTKPWIKNEVVPGWQDQMIRNNDYRFYYRRIFWKMFTHGGSGSSEATWLKLDQPLNQSVKTVMADQMRLRNFIENLRTPINEMATVSGLVTAGPGSFKRTRYKEGREYVTYFHLSGERAIVIDRIVSKLRSLLERLIPPVGTWGVQDGHGQSAAVGKVSVILPIGSYEAIWIDPKTGDISQKETFYSNNGPAIIKHPPFTEDIVLWIISSNLPTSPL